MCSPMPRGCWVFNVVDDDPAPRQEVEEFGRGLLVRGGGDTAFVRCEGEDGTASVGRVV